MSNPARMRTFVTAEPVHLGAGDKLVVRVEDGEIAGVSVDPAPTRAEVCAQLVDAGLGASAVQLSHGAVQPGALAVHLERWWRACGHTVTPERAACLDALRALARAESPPALATDEQIEERARLRRDAGADPDAARDDDRRR